MIGCENDQCPLEWSNFSCLKMTPNQAFKGEWYYPECHKCKKGKGKSSIMKYNFSRSINVCIGITFNQMVQQNHNSYTKHNTQLTIYLQIIHHYHYTIHHVYRGLNVRW